ncbi:MAG TPA: substrate-binding domain-containing protein [Rariglobus sp.]|jgi:phosphate transport system substrate-binding protein|nr:substrate-binding domain-containing protein [Rariglobus sp.]
MRFATLFFLTISLSLSVLRAEVRIVGSDILGKDFVDALAVYSKRNDLGLSLNFTGSESGLEQLRAGTADLGIVVLAPNETKPEAPFVAIPAAYQTAAVVVPAALSLTQITFDQLNSIYSDKAESTIKRWGDLGVTGVWSNRNILPNITGPGRGLSYDLFRYTVLSSPDLRPTVAVQQNADEALSRITEDEGGIAIMALLPSKQPGLKALLVARGPNDVAFGPTEDNVYSGDYPIRLPVFLVFKKSSAKQLQLVLRYLLSEDAVPLWRNAGLMPLPIQARNQQIFDLEVL